MYYSIVKCCQEEIGTDPSRAKNDVFWLLWRMSNKPNKIVLWQKSLLHNSSEAKIETERGMPHRVYFFTSNKILFFSFKNANVQLKVGIVAADNKLTISDSTV